MPPSKPVIIDALVLVFSRSKIKDIVGTDALRSVLDIQYKDLISGNTFDLQGVWDLLAEQPGFDAEFAKPPVARFKQLEGPLGIRIVLPASMKDIGPVEIASTAAECKVPEPELAKIIARHDPRKKAERAARRTESQAPPASPPVDLPARRRTLILIAACGAALAASGFVGLQVYQALAPSASYDKMAMTGLDGIPVKKAERQGRQAVVQLSDDSWLSKRDSAALEKALTALDAKGIEVLVVRDTKGAVKASAQYSSANGGRKMKVQFR